MSGPWESYSAQGASTVADNGPWSQYKRDDNNPIIPPPLPSNGDGGSGNGGSPTDGEKQSVGDSLAGYAGKIRNGLTFGFGDNLSAGIAAPLNMAVNAARGREVGSLGENYDKLLAADRRIGDEFSAEHPIIGAGSEIAGSVASGGALAKALPSVFGLGARGGSIIQGAKAGLTQGAVFGAGAGDEDGLLKGARDGAAMGAVGGAVLGPAVNAASGFARGLAGKAPILNAAGKDLKNLASASYKAADDAGVAFNPDKFKDFVASTREQLIKDGLDSELQSGTTRVLSRLSDAAESGKPLTLTEIENLRRVSMGVNPSNPSDYRMASIIRDKMDDFVENAESAGALQSGDASGIKALQEGRSQWRQLRKNEVIDDIFNKEGATNQTIKQGMRALANNKKRFNQFNPAEKDAIKKAARTGVVEQTLRTIGQLDPTNNRIAGGFGILATAANPANIAAPIAGVAANRTAQALASGTANNARNVVRNAGEAVPNAFERAGQGARSAFGLTGTPNVPNTSGLVGSGSATVNPSIQNTPAPTIQRSPGVRLNSRPEVTAALGAATLPAVVGTGMLAQSASQSPKGPQTPFMAPPPPNSDVTNPQDFDHGNFVDSLTRGVESNGERNAKNPKSSALGPYQMIRSTFAGLVKKYDPDTFNKGNFQNLRTDPEYARKIAVKYSEENVSKLVKEGLPVNPTTAYLAWFADGSTAAKLLKSPANAPADSIFSSQAIEANPFLKGKTVAQVVQWAQKKVSKA